MCPQIQESLNASLNQQNLIHCGLSGAQKWRTSLNPKLAPPQIGIFEALEGEVKRSQMTNHKLLCADALLELPKSWGTAPSTIKPGESTVE